MAHSSNKSSIRSNNQSSAPLPVIENLEERQLLSATLDAAALLHQSVSSSVLTASPNSQSANFAPAVNVAASPTSTVVTSSGTSVYGTAVTLTATVTGATPTGIVTFFDGDTNIGLGTAGANGTWILHISSLNATSHSITAVYGGDVANTTSTSDAFTQTVTRASLTVTGITAANKTYDDTTAAALTTTSAGLTGIVAGDITNVTLVTTNAAGTFSNANAGTGKPVTVSGLTLSGSAAANYTLTQLLTTANITARALTLTGVTANNKIYNGLTTATLDFSNATLSGIFASDEANLTLSTGSASGVFASKNVGTGLAVTVTGVTLAGTAAANYSVAQPTGLTANITPKALTVTGDTASNKTYNGTTAATLNTSHSSIASGLVAGDSHSVTLVKTNVHGTFADASAGNDKTVTITGYSISGSAAANYTFTNPTGVTADITPKALSVTGITASNKTYDGTTTASLVHPNPVLVGVLAADLLNVAISGATATFASSNVGSGIKVTAVVTLSGTAAGNYTVNSPSLSAKITAATLTLTGITAGNKTYDGTTDASLNTSGAVLTGLVASDSSTSFSLANATGTFSGKNVGNALTVTIKGITLTGVNAKNYILTAPANVTANITPKSITVSGITAVSKTYDSTTVAGILNPGAILNGVLSSDKKGVTLSPLNETVSGTFADANVGNNKTVTITGLAIQGSASANYTLVAPTATASITAATLTVTGITADKDYDGTTDVTLDTSEKALSGIQGSDASHLTLNVTNISSPDFSSANAGDYSLALSGITVTGSAAANYTLVQPTISATISTLAVTISDITASNKTYNGKTNAVIDASDPSIDGVLLADLENVSLDTSAAVGTFADANAGVGKTVTISGITLTGSAAANYTISDDPTATATITPKAITVTGVTATSTKVYDGTTSAAVNSSLAIVSGILTNDLSSITLGAATGAYADANAGSAKTVTINIALSGSAAGNYTVTPITTTANITAATLTVSGITADKTYDGTNSATLDFTNAEFTGAVEGDLAHLSLTATSATYATANAGAGIVVTPVGLALTGSAAANYTLTPPTITGTIQQATLTVSGITADKTYDGTNSATLDFTNAEFTGAVEGDLAHLSLTATSATYATANAGTGIVVTPVGLALSGSAAANYTLTPPTITGTIDQLALTVTGVFANNKTENGNNICVMSVESPELVGVLLADTDNVVLDTTNLAGTFPQTTPGSSLPITVTGLALTGSAATNYTVTEPTNLTADIILDLP